MKNGAIHHPFGNVRYQLTEDGNVEVRDGNRSGLFNKNGQWLSGELRQADPQMCVWVTNVHEPTNVIDPKRQGTVGHLS